MRRAAWVSITLALLMGLILSPMATSVDPEPDVFRLVHTYSESPVTEVSCRGDVCSAGLPPLVRFTIQPGIGTVDLTASLTVEYVTTLGDDPLVIMKIKEPGEKAVRMRPGLLALRGGRRTTSTLTWTRRNVDPTAGEYRFSWAFEASHLSPPFRVVAREAVLVIEATPS